jgi:hypothetical protein
MKNSQANSYLSCFYLLVLFFLTSACTGPDTSYFPLSKDKHWRYHITATSMGGTSFKRLFLNSLPSRIIEGETTYIQKSLTGTQFLYQQNDLGIFRIGFIVADGPSLKKIEDEQLILPANIDVGSEWESTVSTQILTTGKPSENGNMQMRARIPVKNIIESNNDVIKVKAGEFQNCLRLHTNGFAFIRGNNNIGRALVKIDQTNWYAPGVGLVKSVLTETSTNDALSRAELVTELKLFDRL